MINKGKVRIGLAPPGQMTILVSLQSGVNSCDRDNVLPKPGVELVTSHLLYKENLS